MSDEVQALVIDNGSGMCKVITVQFSIFFLFSRIKMIALLTSLPFRLALLVMMLPELSSPPLSDAPDTLV